MADGSIHSSPCAASGSVRQNGDAIANGWTAEQMSWMKPGSVSSADRAPPPMVLLASKTTTLHPACASTMAALSPFGPEPTTTASIMRMDAGIAGPMARGTGIIDALAVRARARGDLSRRVHRGRDAVRAAAGRARSRAGGPLGRSRSRSARRRASSISLPRTRVFRACAWLGVALAVFALSSCPQQHGRRGCRRPSGPRSGCSICRSSTSARRSTASAGKRCCARSASSRSSPAPSRIGAEHVADLDLAVDAVPPDVRRRPDQAARRLVLARSDVPDYYFETQPMPNPLSWYFHWMPHGVHAAGVVVNHVVEVIVPFAYFAPQPFASIAGHRHDPVSARADRVGQPVVAELADARAVRSARQRSLAGVAAGSSAGRSVGRARVSRRDVRRGRRRGVLLSIAPVMNMLSPRQMMNASFEPLHLVNTYGAFGSITRERYEIVLEGTTTPTVTDSTTWRDYEFKGKPGDPARRPPQVAPYHLRLDWLMWFEAMAPVAAERLVLQSARRTAAGRPRDAEPAADQSVSRPAAALRSRAVLPLHVHDAGRAASDGRGGTGSSSALSRSRWGCRRSSAGL